MTALNFTESEPTLKSTRSSKTDTVSGNAAFYERLQGQTKKKGIERYGWVALPIAAVAIIGVVAATSTPHSSADDVVGAPGQTAAITPAPAPVKLAAADPNAVTPTAVLSPAEIKAKIDAAPAAIQAPSSAPAPVKLARKAPAPSSDEATTRPAAAAPVTRTAPAPTPAPEATVVNPPVAIQPPAVQPPAATAPADSQAPAVSAAPPEVTPTPVAPAPEQSAPAEAAPAAQ